MKQKFNHILFFIGFICVIFSAWENSLQAAQFVNNGFDPAYRGVPNQNNGQNQPSITPNYSPQPQIVTVANTQT
ncbi:MAG: hypothetical protein OEW97_08815, partial [Gammaproteobacteria bacterium]|nr:hypothetical protein [Gammaproteobacteria bacterium]